MHDLLNHLNIFAFEIAPVFYQLLSMSLTAVCIGIVILMIRRFADQKISPKWKYALWVLVLIALIVPYRPQSNFALLQRTSQIPDISFREEYDMAKGKLHQALEVSDAASEEKTAADKLKDQVNTLFWKSAAVDVAIPLIWFFGVPVNLVFLMFSRLALSRKIKQHTLKNDNYHALLTQCKERLGIKADIQIVLQDYLSFPAMMGFYKPKILLPKYIEDMQEENVSYILLHELLHYKRKDMLVNYFFLAIQALYWFNPLVWMLFRYIREDMELLNDTCLLRYIGSENGKNYACSLVEVLGHSCNASVAPKLLCMADGKKNVERRITMIKLSKLFEKRKVMVSFVCVMVIGIVSVLFLTQAKESRKLTQNEINEVNKAFEQLVPSDDPAYEYIINPVCNFFSSYYDRPEDIRLEQFIWYLGGGEVLNPDNPDDVKQFEKLKKLTAFPFQNVETLRDMLVPIQRKSVALVNEVLSRYAGITVEDLKGPQDVLYLESPYDAFYTYTSDAGAGFFNCKGGEIDGNIIRLFSDDATLTIENKNDQYFILSHIEVPQ